MTRLNDDARARRLDGDVFGQGDSGFPTPPPPGFRHRIGKETAKPDMMPVYAEGNNVVTKTTTSLPIETGTKSSTSPKRLSPFETLRREIDHLFDHFPAFDWQGPSRSALFGPDAEWSRGPGWGIVPAMDLAERDDAYEITVELPGLDEEHIEIRFSNGPLTIKGEKTEESEERKKEYYLSERRYGSFHRSFQLPEGVDTDRIDGGPEEREKIDVKAA